MKKEGLQNSRLTGYISMRDRGKQRVTYLMSKYLTKHSLGGIVKRKTLLRTAKDRRL